MSKTLLPAGCYDVLPPFAHQDSALSATLLSVFESFGYEQVSPPLLEYSDNLLAGQGAKLSAQIFRVMDPAAYRVMGIRPDITLQIARIATGRLSSAPRPLRLCYNELILRMLGEQLKGDRQLRQAGIELIGSPTPEADAEVILVAATALQEAGIAELSIDLNLPGIIAGLMAEDALDNDELEALLQAIAHKDISVIQKSSLSYRDLLVGLLQAAGPADLALPAIDALPLPENAQSAWNDLKAVLTLLKTMAPPTWRFTIDISESRGLTHYSGVSFSMFVPGSATEVGRGGRYMIDHTQATGFTLYVETLRELLPLAQARPRILVADGIVGGLAGQLRSQGYAVIFALGNDESHEAQAKRLGCGFIYEKDKIRKL